MASEALELGKKLLVKPLIGQMEQLSNAEALQQLNLGSVMKNLDASVVEQWLSSQPNIKIQYPDVANAIVQWLLAGDWTASARSVLSKNLWQQVHATDIDNYSQMEKLMAG